MTTMTALLIDDARRGCAGVFLAILIGFAACLQPLQAAEQYETPADGSFESLLNAARRMIDATPSPLLLRAMEYRNKGETDKALADCNEAVRLTPKYVLAYLLRAEIWGDKIQWDKAVADASEAIKLMPGEANLLQLRAWAWTMQREAGKGLADANEAVRVAPTEWEPYFSRAMVWLLKHDFDRARADLDRVIEIAPKDSPAYGVRGVVWQIQGDEEKARADYARAGELFREMAKDPHRRKQGKVAPKPAARRDPSPQARFRMERGRITISRETTHATGPVAEDGYVDLLAALNEECSRGVTPENNAAALIWEALGPARLPADRRVRFFQLLKIPQPREGTRCYIPPEDYAKAHPLPSARGKQQKKVEDAIEVLQNWATRPWSKADFPVAAEYLEANQAALDKIVEASRRPRYYSPLVAADTRLPVINALCGSEIPVFRELGRVFAARAMLRLQQGKSEEAWQEVLAIHRLSRLLGQGPILDNQLVAGALGTLASTSTAAMAHYGHPSPETAQRWARDLDELPPLPKTSDAIRRGERYVFLDVTQEIARHGPRGLSDAVSTVAAASGVGEQRVRRVSGAPTIWLYNASVDWDEVLRRGNAWYDRLAVAAAKPTRSARDQALGEIENEFRVITDGGETFRGRFPRLFMGLIPSDVTSRQMSDFVLAMTTPSIGLMLVKPERNQVALDHAQISLALAGYRADHRQYPDRLADLAPQYMPRVPRDPITGGELQYKRQGEGYLLYSVGSNGKDDGGRECNADPPGDDLVLRMPAEPE